MDGPHQRKPRIAIENYNALFTDCSYRELEDLAEAGDGVAAFVLYLLLSRCRHAPRTKDALEVELLRRAGAGTSSLDGHAIEEGPGGAMLSADELRASFNFYVTVPDPKRTIEDRFKWLAAALDEDEPGALYFLVSEGDAESDLNLPRLAGMRRQAASVLDCAAMEGIVPALEAMWRVYRSGRSWLMPDLARAYAYQQASFDIQMSSHQRYVKQLTSESDQNREQHYASIRNDLSDQQVIEARVIQERIMDVWLATGK